jgi:hypothetical protein
MLAYAEGREFAFAGATYGRFRVDLKPGRGFDWREQWFGSHAT